MRNANLRQRRRHDAAVVTSGQPCRFWTPIARRPPIGLSRLNHAMGIPMSKPITMVPASAINAMRPLNATCAPNGRRSVPSHTSSRIPRTPMISPHSPPASVRVVVSIKASRTIRARLEPIARRIATSLILPVARMSSRLTRFTAPIMRSISAPACVRISVR